MTIKTEKPLDYTGQVWRGIDDKFPKKIHNATTTSDGLMSAEDKAKLDSIDAKGVNQIYDVASEETDGFMSKEDKKKLNRIEENANNYIHPNNEELRHVTDLQIEYWNSKASTNVVTIQTNGLMSSMDKAKLDFINEEVCNLVYEPATHFEDGLMSYDDKIKLDKIDANANYYVHPNNEGTRHVSDAEKSYWNSKADKDIVTNTENGLMAYVDKIKLDGIEDHANNYIHPDDENTRHVTDEQIKKWTSVATTSRDGLLSKEDKQLLVKLSEIYPDLQNTIHTQYQSAIEDILVRLKHIEEELENAVFYK